MNDTTLHGLESFLSLTGMFRQMEFSTQPPFEVLHSSISWQIFTQKIHVFNNNLYFFPLVFVRLPFLSQLNYTTCLLLIA